MPEPEIPTPVAPPNTDSPQSGTPPVPTGFSDTPPSAPATPAGFSDTRPTPQNGENPLADVTQKQSGLESMAEDVATGVGKGLESTTEGIGSLIHKIPGIGPKIIPSEGLKAEGIQATPHGTAQWVGYGGENLAEFMLGDEALKGMSMADKFKQISGVMGILEKSPRLMRAVQTGVDIGKAASELGPEEQAAIKKSPILSRLVSAGMDAIRQGTVQGAQTAVKSGGDVGKAAEEGATTGLASGVLGGAFGLMGRAAEKAGEAGKAVQEASAQAAAAPTKLEAGQKVADQINQAEQAMHGDFEEGIQKLKGALGDQKVPLKGSPIQKAAQEALQGKTEAKGVLGGGLQKIAGGSNDAKNLLNDWADEKKTGDLTIDELVQARQQLGEKIGQIAKGTTSSADRADVAVYQKLRDGLDSTIEQMAKQSPSPEASQDYAALRNAYKSKVNLFKEPVVRAIQEGDLDNAGKYLLSGGKVLDKVNTLQQVIGEQGVKDFGQTIARNIMSDVTPENGQINPAKFAKDWKKIDSLSPEIKEKLFDMKGAADGLDQLANGLKSAANYQKLVRSGVLSTAGSAGAALHPAGGLGVMLGILGAGDMGKATEVLDKIANNPRLWSTFRTAAKASEKVAASPVAQRAATAVKYGTGSTLSNIMQGAQEPLANPIQPDEQGVLTNQ